MRKGGLFHSILHDERGATAIEYGLIVALIVIAMTAALKDVANENTGLWGRTSNTVINAISA